MLPIDLRSDTVTRPTPDMRTAMANAEVDDAVLGTDPTTEMLEQALAKRLGKEAALFMPSGTMTNQVAVRLHCQPGDELLCERFCHIYNYEQGAFAQLSGIVAHPIASSDGLLRVQDIEDRIRPWNEHLVRARLLCLENTHAHSGGMPLPYDQMVEVCRWAREHDLRSHLDGARLFNAVIATGREADVWAAPFDTVSVCFSKGLGAPVGSALAGPKETIARARWHRKLFGGGMRQSGILAAAALFALQHHVQRLAEDHRNARLLGQLLATVTGVAVAQASVETNIVFFDIDPSLGTSYQIVQRLSERGVLLLAETKYRIRALTHLDVTEESIRQAVSIIEAAIAD